MHDKNNWYNNGRKERKFDWADVLPGILPTRTVSIEIQRKRKRTKERKEQKNLLRVRAHCVSVLGYAVTLGHHVSDPLSPYLSLSFKWGLHSETGT